MTTPWTLITVTFNSAETLMRYWAAGIPDGVEWIVVDNGSSDDSAAAARELGASQVIELGKNVGFSAANNEGFTRASHDYVAFVNPDVRVVFADLEGLAERVDAHGGLVAPQLINDDSTPQPNGRGMPMLMHKVINRVSRGARLTDTYLLYATDKQERYVFWLIGAVLAGRAETFAGLQAWNERFFLYYEDKDISLRAWRAGIPVLVCGQFRWTHGWARETSRLRLTPWVREIASLVTFYSLYPELLFGGAPARRRHPLASKRSGEVVPID